MKALFMRIDTSREKNEESLYYREDARTTRKTHTHKFSHFIMHSYCARLMRPDAYVDFCVLSRLVDSETFFFSSKSSFLLLHQQMVVSVTRTRLHRLHTRKPPAALRETSQIGSVS